MAAPWSSAPRSMPVPGRPSGDCVRATPPLHRRQADPAWRRGDATGWCVRASWAGTGCRPRRGPAVGAVGLLLLVAAPVAVGDVLEPSALVDAPRRAVALEHVEAQPVGAVLLRRREEEPTGATPLRLGSHVEVLEPAGFGRGEAERR